MPSQEGTQLTPLALSILGLENAGFLPPSNRPATASQGETERTRTNDRRVNSYFNQFQSRCTPSKDTPPTYATASRQARFPASPRFLDNGNEILPKYTCSVYKEGPMYMLLESCSPFVLLPSQEWREVFVIVRGTQLCVHKLKTSSFGEKKIYSPGRLVRKYTLQQAEIGVAPDVSHTILLPQTRMASLIPTIARRRAFEKDPTMFRVEKQYALRMRAELDQFTLCCPSEEQIFSWVNHISAGIDIAPALDERSIPRQCTMPRRRRRPQRPITATNLNDQRLIEEQQRILQSLYPAFAEDGAAPSTEATVSTADATSSPIVSSDIAPGEQEQEDVDLSMISEDSALSSSASASSTPRRPQASRLNTSETIASTTTGTTADAAIPTTTTIVHTSCLNFDLFGKWAPLHPRTAAQQLRYIRRCMPLLLESTPRHSSVLVGGGQYCRPNYRTEKLENWTLAPPKYDAHDFGASGSTVAGAERIEEEQETTRQSEPETDSLARSTSSASAAALLEAAGNEIQRADTPAQDMQIPAADSKKKVSNSKEARVVVSEVTASSGDAKRGGGGAPRRRTEREESGMGFVLVGF